ncbi:flagellar hook-length control protein FliK [Paracoccaceae bacterium Fryx2]|nr:flagellar hook-length control protein FliK [Paracoccaceae bacterium Fryx2]
MPTRRAEAQALPPTVAPALIEAVRQSPGGPVELTLAPEELGRLRMTLHQDGDSIRVTLLVERAETLDLLRRHGDQLWQEFRQAGFTGGSLSFGQWGGQGTRNHPPQSADAPPDPAPHASAAPPAATPARTVGDTGLDLRM